MCLYNIITQTQSKSCSLPCWFCSKEWLKDFIDDVLRNAGAIVNYFYFSQSLSPQRGSDDASLMPTMPRWLAAMMYQDCSTCTLPPKYILSVCGLCLLSLPIVFATAKAHPWSFPAALLRKWKKLQWLTRSKMISFADNLLLASEQTESSHLRVSNLVSSSLRLDSSNTSDDEVNRSAWQHCG